MKLLIILLMAAAAFWLWKGQERQETIEPAAQESAEAAAIEQGTLVGRWRNDAGQNFAFRENGSFNASRRDQSMQEGIEIDFTASFRGQWQQNGQRLTCTIEQVEGVTVLSARPTAGNAFGTTSAADTAVNRARQNFPRSYTGQAAGRAMNLSLETVTPRELHLRDGGKVLKLIRVE